MAEELQNLLDKINENAVKKGEAERDRIIADARAEAAKIIADAEREAKAKVEEAEKNGAAFQGRALAAVKQASRDLMFQLKEELKKRLEKALAGATAQAFSPEMMASLIKDLAAKFAADPDAQLTVRAAAKDLPALDAALRKALANTFRNAPKLFASSGIKAGLEVSFDENQCYFDFSDEAVSELLSAYVGEQLALIFRDEAK